MTEHSRQSGAELENMFVDTPCPLCGATDHEVIIPSRYTKGLSPDELSKAYSASSDTQLLDQLVRCASCSLVFVNPRLQDDVITNSYSEAVDPTFVAQNPERIKTFSRILRGVAEQFNLRPRSETRILDVGCAGGAFVKAAADLGYSATGVEPSHWLAEFGRREYGADIRQGLLTKGLFPEQTFDAISLWDVIEHVPSPGELLNLIHSLLKPGGLLLVNYPDYGSLPAKLMRSRWPFLLSVHLLYYTRQTITRQLQQSGYEVLRIQPHWQSLPTGYVLQRAAHLMPVLSFAKGIAEAVGLGNVPLKYNMGQTLVVARRS